MQFPNLIIIGVFKAGTTSLFRYLANHPDICGSSKKEIHYFTPFVFGDDKPTLSIEEYSAFFSCEEEKYRLEASPAYFYGVEKVIKCMEQILPDDHNVILILRNPLDRFISYYKHIRSQFLIDDDFSTFTEECIKEFHASDEFRIGHYKNAIREGLYSEYIQAWDNEYGENLKVIFFDDLKKNPLLLMQNIARWLQINDLFFKKEKYTVENKTVIPKHAMLHRLAISTYRSIQPMLGNSTIKKMVRNVYTKINSDENIDYEIDDHSKLRLQEIFEPYNLKLKDYLGELPENWVKE